MILNLKKKDAKKISSILIHREIKIEKKKYIMNQKCYAQKRLKRNLQKKGKRKKKKENEEREGKKY